jgi:hypothetical protein
MLVSERRAQPAVTTASQARTAADVSLIATSAADLSPTAAWALRGRSIGGLIQAAFAAFWLIRGSLAIGGRVADVLIAVFSITVIGVFCYVIRATGGIAPRPMSSEAKRIERAITLATVIELAAAFVLPVIVIAAGHSDWVLPSVAITVGPLLLYLDHLVHIPRYRPVGWALIVGPVILVATMSGTVLVATTGIAGGALLLGTAVAGFHDLARDRRRAEQADTSDLAVFASAAAQP